MKRNPTPITRRKRTIKKSLKRSFKWMWRHSILVAVVIAGILGLLCYKRFIHRSVQLHEHVSQLATILKQIHSSCKITGYTQELNPIDFLNVKEFSGSILGSFQFESPENWKGPYTYDSIGFKGHPFALLVNKDGYFIVPGNGSILDDGTIVGKDIIFDSQTDIKECLKKYPGLFISGKCLIAHISLDGKSSHIS